MFFFFQAEDGIRDYKVTGVQTCALPISCGDANLSMKDESRLAVSGLGPSPIHITHLEAEHKSDREWRRMYPEENRERKREWQCVKLMLRHIGRGKVALRSGWI